MNIYEKTLIIADDLTGACDTAVKYHDVNTPVKSIVDYKDFDFNCFDQADVISVNSESRNMPTEDAYRIVFEIATKISGNDVNIYKKIDSVMRGNILEEINAVLDATHINLAIVVPAYPENGRISANGNLHLYNGKQWINTNKSWLDILAKGTRKTCLINTQKVRLNKEIIASDIDEAIKTGIEIIVIDAENDDDLNRIAEAICMMESKNKVLLVGSAGLAKHISNLLHKQKKSGRILSVIGTNHRATSDQLTYIFNRQDLLFCEIDLAAILAAGFEKEIEGIFNYLEENLAINRVTSGVVLTVNTKSIAELDSDFPIEEFLRDSLGRVSKRLLECSNFDFNKLLLTGGETAFSLLRKLDVKMISLFDEPIGGIACGTAYLNIGKPRKYWIATKSGGFGHPDTLDKIINYLIEIDSKE